MRTIGFKNILHTCAGTELKLQANRLRKNFKPSNSNEAAFTQNFHTQEFPTANFTEFVSKPSRSKSCILNQTKTEVRRIFRLNVSNRAVHFIAELQAPPNFASNFSYELVTPNKIRELGFSIFRAFNFRCSKQQRQIPQSYGTAQKFPSRSSAPLLSFQMSISLNGYYVN